MMGGLKASGAELCHATYLCSGLEACREPRKPGRIPQGTGHAAPHAMLHRRHQHPSIMRTLISPYRITSQCGLMYTVRVRVYVVVVLDSNSLLGLVSHGQRCLSTLHGTISLRTHRTPHAAHLHTVSSEKQSVARGVCAVPCWLARCAILCIVCSGVVNTNRGPVEYGYVWSSQGRLEYVEYVFTL